MTARLWTVAGMGCCPITGPLENQQSDRAWDLAGLPSALPYLNPEGRKLDHGLLQSPLPGLRSFCPLPDAQVRPDSSQALCVHS